MNLMVIIKGLVVGVLLLLLVGDDGSLRKLVVIGNITSKLLLLMAMEAGIGMGSFIHRCIEVSFF